MAGSSMRPVRLNPQGPGPDRGPDRPVQIQRKFTKQDHFGPRNFQRENFLSSIGARRDHDPALLSDRLRSYSNTTVYYGIHERSKCI